MIRSQLCGAGDGGLFRRPRQPGGRDRHRPEKVARLRQGISPIYEPGIEEVVAAQPEGRAHRFTTDYAEGLEGAEFVFIAVGTPEGPDGAADMWQVEVGGALHRQARRRRPDRRQQEHRADRHGRPGDAGWCGERIAPGVQFAVVSNPEFLREGSALADFMQPGPRRARLVRPRSPASAWPALYEPLHAPIIITDIRTAEMIKYASNAFLATKISFINEIAHICERLGADVKQVARAWAYDQRIGRAVPRRGHRLRRLLLPEGRQGAGAHGRARTAATRSCCAR